MSEEPIKEEFCGACLAIPIALAGAGVSASSYQRGQHKSNRNTLLIVSTALLLLSLFIGVYWFWIKPCNDCK